MNQFWWISIDVLIRTDGDGQGHGHNDDDEIVGDDDGDDDGKEWKESKQWEDPILAHRQHSLWLQRRPQTKAEVEILTNKPKTNTHIHNTNQ